MNHEFLSKTFFVVLLIGLVVLAAKVIRQFWTAVASRHWPVAHGRIIAMKMDVAHTMVEELYTPGLTYRYQVDDKDYEGNRIDLTSQSRFFTQSAANAVLEDYSPDAAEAVYYNPRRPADCLLKPGVSLATWVITGLIIVLLIVVSFTLPLM